MERKKHYIRLGKVDKNIIYLIIGAISKFMLSLISKYFGENVNAHPLIYAINAACGMCLSIFPFIYIKILTKRLEKKEKEALTQKKLIFNDSYEEHYHKMRCKKYFLILLSSMLDFGQKFLTILYNDEIIDNFWIFDILFVNIFSIFILKTKLYRFQYLSLSIIIVLGIIMNIFPIYNLQKIYILLIILSIEVMYSLKNVINKYSMELNFCSPYIVGFYEGFFALIVNILILYFTKLDNFKVYYNKLDTKEIIIFIVMMISRWFFNIFGLITVKAYTPSHIVLILIIGEIAFIFFKDYNWVIYPTIVIFIFILFMLLVFTEIIELHFCGLQYDTKKNIAQRALSQEMDEASSNCSEEEDGRLSNISRNSLGRNSIND